MEYPSCASGSSLMQDPDPPTAAVHPSGRAMAIPTPRRTGCAGPACAVRVAPRALGSSGSDDSASRFAPSRCGLCTPVAVILLTSPARLVLFHCEHLLPQLGGPHRTENRSTHRAATASRTLTTTAAIPSTFTFKAARLLKG